MAINEDNTLIIRCIQFGDVKMCGEMCFRDIKIQENLNPLRRHSSPLEWSHQHIQLHAQAPRGVDQYFSQT